MKELLRSIYMVMMKVMCALAFFVFFIPLGALFRCMKWDRLIRLDKGRSTYWVRRPSLVSTGK